MIEITEIKVAVSDILAVSSKLPDRSDKISAGENVSAVLPTLTAKAAKILRILPAQITELQILKRSIDARKKDDVRYSYRVAVSVLGDEAAVLAKASRGKASGKVRAFSETVYRVEDGTAIWGDALTLGAVDATVSGLASSADGSTVSVDSAFSVGNTGAVNGANVGSVAGCSETRPVVVGAGPAGLFAAYRLALAGRNPLILERGKAMDQRTADVSRFFETGILNPHSNVQFGEGGAGAFSDGKLNTLVNDKFGRNRFVLETFVKCGADESILYDAKPHIGTDALFRVIPNLRKEIERLGGEFRFETCVTDLQIEGGALRAVTVQREAEQTETIPTDAAILAIGHSARDTFEMLYQKGVPMCEKDFAVGFRVEHPQEFIDRAQYGDFADKLPPAPYKLTANVPVTNELLQDETTLRGVYSFCMCPGGYVVNAASENGGVCVNGMSNHARDGKNANSAIVVSVGARDFAEFIARNGETGTAGTVLAVPLSGIYYQHALEQCAFSLSGGKIPQQLYGDFLQNTPSKTYGAFSSETKGATKFTNLRNLFSKEIEAAFISGMTEFDKKIRGFAREDAILSGIESRTSSPVRILRDETCESEIKGLYPCGEGAGYAGGIMSAAMDGLKCAEAMLLGWG